LRAVRLAAVILAPRRFLRIAEQVLTGDMMMLPISARRMRLKNSSARRAAVRLAAQAP